MKVKTHRQIIQDLLEETSSNVRMISVLLDSNTGKEIKESFPSAQEELERIDRFLRKWHDEVNPLILTIKKC